MPFIIGRNEQIIVAILSIAMALAATAQADSIDSGSVFTNGSCYILSEEDINITNTTFTVNDSGCYNNGTEVYNWLEDCSFNITSTTTEGDIISTAGAMAIGTIMIIWLFIWKRNRLLAGVSLLGIGLGTELLTQTGQALGWIAIAAGLITITYEAYGTFKAKSI